MKLTKCKVCNNKGETEIYNIREMMFGFNEEFTYFQCPKCECLQIDEIPENISKYYPSNYYSFTPQLGNSLKKLIRISRNKFAFYDKGVIGKLIYRFFPIDLLKVIAQVDNLNKQSYILDVGCGNGSLLLDFKDLGFNNLLGVDPFIEKDIEYDNHLKIEKKSIHEVNGRWDLIMFHHSFEHISDPLYTLKDVYNLLTPNGTCLIHIPTSSSFAWEHYKENWVQLDAPRHFFLHSTKSIGYLADKAGLVVEKVIYNSTDFQFWGSEQNLRGINLMDPRSRFFNNKSNAVFSKKEILNFKSRAKELNEQKRGDTIVAFLRKKEQ